jgi:hypothetical protein
MASPHPSPTRSSLLPLRDGDCRCQPRARRPSRTTTKTPSMEDTNNNHPATTKATRVPVKHNHLNNLYHLCSLSSLSSREPVTRAQTTNPASLRATTPTKPSFPRDPKPPRPPLLPPPAASIRTPLRNLTHNRPLNPILTGTAPLTRSHKATALATMSPKPTLSRPHPSLKQPQNPSADSTSPPAPSSTGLQSPPHLRRSPSFLS